MTAPKQTPPEESRQRKGKTMENMKKEELSLEEMRGVRSLTDEEIRRAQGKNRVYREKKRMESVPASGTQ